MNRKPGRPAASRSGRNDVSYFASRLRRVERVLLACAIEVLQGIGMPEHVRSFELATASKAESFSGMTRLPVSFLLVL